MVRLTLKIIYLSINDIIMKNAVTKRVDGFGSSVDRDQALPNRTRPLRPLLTTPNDTKL